MSSKSTEEFTVLKPESQDFQFHEIKGEPYIDILEKTVKIARFQQQNIVKRGIKGMIFHGDVGIGKTTVAKAISKKLGAPLIFVDGSDIARSLYGQSEQRITKLFKFAEKFHYSVILIDDCESVFPKRDWLKGESWHIAQNNVFFHTLDNLDTSKMIVILTTNRYDLLDQAIIDRLYSIEFPLPDQKTLKDILRDRAIRLNLPEETLLPLISDIEKGTHKSMRSLEKSLMEQYIDYATKL